MSCKILLYKLTELCLVACCWSNQKLKDNILFTLADTLFLENTFNIYLKRSPLSSLILSHSSKTTHLSSDKSSVVIISHIFLVKPTIIWPYYGFWLP